MRVLAKERKGEKIVRITISRKRGYFIDEITFVRSSLDKGAEKSQCGENESLHCVFLFW